METTILKVDTFLSFLRKVARSSYFVDASSFHKKSTIFQINQLQINQTPKQPLTKYQSVLYFGLNQRVHVFDSFVLFSMVKMKMCYTSAQEIV